MARKGTSSRSTRGSTHAASDPLIRSGLLPAPSIRPLRIPIPELLDDVLSSVEDLRKYHPLGRLRARVKVDSLPASNRRVVGRAFEAVGFERPDHVIVCLKRKRRREVIFAKRKQRKGASARRRRNAYSYLRC